MTWRFASSAARRQTRSRPIPRSPVPTDEVPADIPIPPNPPTVPRSSVAPAPHPQPSVGPAGLTPSVRGSTAPLRPDPPPSPPSPTTTVPPAPTAPLSSRVALQPLTDPQRRRSVTYGYCRCLPGRPHGVRPNAVRTERISRWRAVEELRIRSSTQCTALDRILAGHQQKEQRSSRYIVTQQFLEPVVR